MDCPALDADRARVVSTLEAASGDQQSRATRDAIAIGAGLVVHGMFSLLLTNSYAVEVEVSRLKGEVQAIDRALLARKCPSATGK